MLDLSDSMSEGVLIVGEWMLDLSDSMLNGVLIVGDVGSV